MFGYDFDILITKQNVKYQKFDRRIMCLAKTQHLPHNGNLIGPYKLDNVK